MGDLYTLREALKSAMAAAMPTRVVTRDHKDFGERAEADLVKGVVTIVGLGEKDFSQWVGRETQLGTLPVLIVGQIKVAEGSAPSAVEDAEDTLIEEIKAFCAAPPAGLGSLSMKGWRQSGQLEAPWGWVSVDVEVLT
jgi:hypothetical protein